MLFKHIHPFLFPIFMSPDGKDGGGVAGSGEEYPPLDESEVGDDDVDAEAEAGDKGDAEPDEADGEGEKEAQKGEGDAHDDGKKEPEPEEPKKPKQDPAYNAKMKALRLQREADEKARREAEIAKARQEGAIEALGGVNPYTGDKITDESDLQVFRIMKSIKDRGGDPIQDYWKEALKLDKERKAASAAATKSESEKKAAMEEEVSRWSKEHPDLDLGKVLDDPKFKEFSEDKHLMEKVGLNVCYDLYQTKLALEAERAAAKKRREAGRRSSQEGSVNGSGGSSPDVYTMEEIQKMSPSEIRANLDKVLRSQRYHAKNSK